MSRFDTGTDDPRVRVRAAKSSRPRTKDRPDFSHHPRGTLLSIDRGRYRVLLPSGTILTCVKARELGRGQLAVGDEVTVTGDLSGCKDTLARIVAIGERRTQLRRTAEDDGVGKERILVANADQLCIVTAAANPTPRPGMIDRLLVAALAGGLKPLLVITKTDLSSSAQLEEIYAPLGLEIFLTQFQSQNEKIHGLANLSAALQSHMTVLVGHSGVGKSTLTNALVPGADRATGKVNDVTGRGRHTSSSAIALELPNGGFVIDTPGVRTFGLAHVTPDTLLAGFPDLLELTDNCPRGCLHHEGAEECELENLSDPILLLRCKSYRRLLSAHLSS